jgi:iron(III) transport system substrate-binding protein
MARRTTASRLTLIVCLPSVAGCLPRREAEVVVYAALDQEFSAPVLKSFSHATGIYVRPKFDVESTKTVGLANAIIAEANRPRCDVFWNNEILNTLRLKERGLLEAYRPPAAKSYPDRFRDSEGAWHGFAGRARILIVNTQTVPEAERPASIYDLADPKWKGKLGMAKPLFGTTATHAACLFAALGEQKARKFFMDLKANDIRIESGNKQVAESVARGVSAFGLTDTDDALVMIDRGEPVEIIYPDRREGQLGSLFIPNTLCIIKGCPHPQQARRLIDYLLQPSVEAQLALGPSGQIPLNPAVEVELRVETPKSVKAMEVDFEAAARNWERAAAFLRDQFAAD